MKRHWVLGVLLGCLGVLSSTPEINAGTCSPDEVWVPPHTTSEGVWINGFCRPVAKKGFVWVDGHFKPQGIWVPGFWKPIDPPPPGKAWVPGYLNPRGVWVPGYWRAHQVPGKNWIPGHYNRKGHWVPGHHRRK